MDATVDVHCNWTYWSHWQNTIYLLQTRGSLLRAPWRPRCRACWLVSHSVCATGFALLPSVLFCFGLLTLQKGNLFTEEWFKDITVFFMNKCKNRNCPLFKNYISTLHYYYNPLHCLYWRQSSSPFDSPKKFLSFLYYLRFRHSWKVSGHKSYKRAGFWSAKKNRTTKNESSLLIPGSAKIPSLCSSVMWQYLPASWAVLRAVGRLWLPGHAVGGGLPVRGRGTHAILVGGILPSICTVRGVEGN